MVTVSTVRVLLDGQIFPPVCDYPVLALCILASIIARMVSSNAGAACTAKPVASLRKTTYEIFLEGQHVTIYF